MITRYLSLHRTVGNRQTTVTDNGPVAKGNDDSVIALRISVGKFLHRHTFLAANRILTNINQGIHESLSTNSPSETLYNIITPWP